MRLRPITIVFALAACQTKPKATATVAVCAPKGDTAFSLAGDSTSRVKAVDVAMSLRVCDSTHGQLTIKIYKPGTGPVVAPK